MNKEASNKLRVLSFAFTIVIVGYHSNHIIDHLYTSNMLRIIVDNIWEYLANVAMSFFFMTTGFLLYKDASKDNIYEKLKRRIYTIIIPFALWNTLYWLLSLSIHGIQEDIFHILYRFSFDPYDGPLWYLFAISVLSLFSPLVFKLRKTKWFQYLIYAICLISLIVYGLHVFTTLNDMHIASWTERLCRYIPSYILGAAIGIHGNEYLKIIDDSIHKKIQVLIVMLSMLWIIVGQYIPDLIKCIILLFMPVIIWINLPSTLRNYHWMRNSFIIYAIHRMILTGLTMIENKLNIVGGGGTQFTTEKWNMCCISIFRLYIYLDSC